MCKGTMIFVSSFVLSIGLAIGPFSGVARADFTKTIQATPGVEVNAVTTWYYSSCTASLGLGSYTINVAPTHGVLAFADLNGPIPGCPAGSPSLPAVAAYYTWTDSNTFASDYFQLYYMINGQVGEVIDVTVNNTAATPPPPPPACTITSQTIATVTGIDNTRLKVGVGEYVVLDSGSLPVTWSASGGGTLTELVTGASGTQACSPTLPAAPIVGTQACFTAPYTNANTTITGQLADGSSCPIAFTTVQPSGLIFQRMLAPPLPDKGYGFFDTTLPGGYQFLKMAMYSAVFLTPGDVSFANVGISEHDTQNPSILYEGSPLLLPIKAANANAWFIGCDHDTDQLIRRNPVLTKQSYWFYTYGAGSETAFSLVQTQLSALPYGDYLYTKGQVQALAPAGTFLPTPGVPAAVLALSAETWPSFLPDLGDNCRPDIMEQFGGTPYPMTK